MYKVIFQANDTEYKSKDKNLFDAFSAIPLHFMDCKTKANVIVTHGKKRAEKLLVLRQARMLLHNHLRRAGWARNFETLLK